MLEEWLTKAWSSNWIKYYTFTENDDLGVFIDRYGKILMIACSFSLRQDKSAYTENSLQLKKILFRKRTEENLPIF